MLKLFKGLNKFIEGILYVFIPIIVFYWSLTLVNLDIIRPLVIVIGVFIEPLMHPLKNYITFIVHYDGFSVDYTILVFAGLILAIAVLFTINGNILTFIEIIIEKIKYEAKIKDRKRKAKETEEEYIKEINKNRTIYVLLKLTRNQVRESYLIKDDGNDFFSVGLIDSYENSIYEFYKKFSGKPCGIIGGVNNQRGFIFTDINDFLKFLPYLSERIEEINKGMLDLNTVFTYKTACHCSLTDANADIDLDITAKILNLCGNKEILLSELIKERLELTENKNFKLYSRGIYLINDKQMDVFKLIYN